MKRFGNDIFLTRHSLWLSATLIVVLPTILAALGPSVVRRYVKLEKLVTNNEIAGFKFATIGVLYAVLLAFATIVVWQKLADADENVTREAAGATTIYRLPQGLNQQSAIALREGMSNYLTVAINREWPAMARGATDEYRPTRLALDAVYSTLLSSQPSTPREAAVYYLSRRANCASNRHVRAVCAISAWPSGPRLDTLLVAGSPH